MSNDIKELHPLILLLANANQRESALLVLSKNRETFPELVPVLVDPSPFTASSVTQDEVSKRGYVLDTLLFLLRSRYNTNLHPALRKMVVAETNLLYRGSLGMNIMKSMKDGMNHLKVTDEYRSTDVSLRKMAECLFFMYYGTQIEEGEVRGLVDLIKFISESLVDTLTPETVEEWKTSAYAVLSVLQITHVSALDQFNSLLQRTSDDISTADDDINALKQTPGSKEGMDTTWRSKGAKGLACLAYAVLRQPAVDSNEAPAADVVWFLKEAANMRAYSYIRLCLLPVLQCSHVKDEEHFFISVLCELLRKVAHIFHIYELARHPDRPHFLRSYDLSLARSGSDGSPLIRSDCLDDVMHLFAVVCSIRPSFAEAFRDVDAQGASALHPFVVTSLEASDRQPCLVLPSMRLLTGVGSGLNGSTAGATYHFLRGGRHPRLKWDHLFFCIEGFAKQMGSVSAVTAPGTIPSSVAAPTAVRAPPPNPKDEEGLLAIIDLIGVCVQDSHIADSLYSKYDPIKKLFALLACPIPIALKGAIFRALAAFVKSSSAVAEEVWEFVELYRLLPAKGLGGGQQGLRFELEETEVGAGVYPSTEGFLQLLDALLCYHNTPDNLGMGYRRPGLMVYLEFVVDDVLLRAHERPYAPEGTHKGMTQKWRLTARALKILVSVMQHYAINRLPTVPLLSLPHAVREDIILQGVAADFREEMAVYKIDDLPEQRCSRPKTLGFTLMALLLGRSRLLERVLSLLGECSVPALEAERSLHGAETAKASIEILGTMQPAVKVSSPGGVYGGAASIDEIVDLEIDLSMLGFNDDAFGCDGSYWMEKTVSNCIGLLYECSLRECRFLEFIRAAPPLTILRSEDGRTAALPVMVQGGLVEALSSSLALGTVAHFMRLPAQRWHSVPSVPVMATRLLEHVSVYQPSERFLWAMRSTAEEEGFLLSGCVRAIIEGDETEISAVFKEVFPLGADRYPDVFTQSVASSGTPPDITEALRVAASGSMDSSETARGALLCLMLRALVLTPDRVCLTHQLLGMRQAIEEGGSSSTLPALLKPHRNYIGDMPVNCLQAVLLLIAPVDSAYVTSPACSLIQREPELACICYEIICHLASSPLSSSLTLGYLRSHVVQFLRVQMQELLYLACLPDSLLLRRDEGSEDAESSRSTQLEEVKAARHSCTAYVLQIFALELRAQERSANFSPMKMKELLDLLFAVNNAQRGALGSRGGNTPGGLLPVMTVLNIAIDLPVLSLPSIVSPILIRCLQAATMPYSVSRGGQATSLGFATVSISLFTKLVRDEVTGLSALSPIGGRANTVLGSAEFEDALKAAVLMNVYNKRAAASAHLCLAWSQLVDVSVLGCGGVLISAPVGDGDAEDTVTALRRLVTSVVLPTLHVLSAAPLEMVMAEQLVKSMLSIVSTLRAPSGSNQPLLSTDENQTLLSALIRSLLRRAGGHGVPRSSSLLYRGFLYSCITRVLQSSLSSAVLAIDQGASDEGKGNEIRGHDELMALEQCSTELCDTLGTDACTGAPLWRVVALAALSSVLTSLGPSRTQQSSKSRDSKHCRGNEDIYGFPSRSYLQALQTLARRGHISAIMGYIGQLDNNEPNADPNLSEPGSQELFESSVSLCVSLATTREGGALLLENGFLARVCALQFFRTPPPSAEEISPFGDNGVALREEAIRLMEARLAPVLRVMRCLCVVSPFQPVIEGAARFLQLNHLLVSYLLRLRTHTLKGLALTEAVLASMVLVVSSSTEAPSKQARHSADATPSQPRDGAVWDMLGDRGDTFITDICGVLRILGGEPMPRQGRGMGRETGGWWVRYLPSTAQEDLLSKVIITPSSGWSAFDQNKLMLSLRVTSLAAAFLRKRSCALRSGISSGSYEGTGEGDLLAMDFDAISLAFVACAGLTNQKGTSSSSAVQWLTNTSAIEPSFSSSSSLALVTSDDRTRLNDPEVDNAVPALLYITENLICVLHNMNAAASVQERACWALDLDRCVGVAERDFPSHSYVKQVGRWIRDQMNHETL